jgi:hypothetical protein
MGFFFKALAAIVTADAIDRAARRPPKYWYPKQPPHRPQAAWPACRTSSPDDDDLVSPGTGGDHLDG